MKSSIRASSHLAWVDLTRFLGAFLVVLAHVVTYPSLMGKGTFWAQTVYYTTTRMAVPLFFMLSGMLLLAKEEPLAVFFRKRAFKVMFPFFVWSLIYYYWYNYSASTGGELSFFLLGIVKTFKIPRAAHLWFFYSLIGLYIATPILRCLYSPRAKPIFFIFVALGFLLSQCLVLSMNSFRSL